MTLPRAVAHSVNKTGLNSAAKHSRPKSHNHHQIKRLEDITLHTTTKMCFLDIADSSFPQLHPSDQSMMNMDKHEKQRSVAVAGVDSKPWVLIEEDHQELVETSNETTTSVIVPKEGNGDNEAGMTISERATLQALLEKVKQQDLRIKELEDIVAANLLDRMDQMV